jgi:hypothetical protein
MAIDEKEFGDFKLETRTNTNTIFQFIEMWKSTHHDDKQRFEKLENLIAEMPTKSDIALMFKDEGEKLARGLIKKDEEQDIKIGDLKTEMATIITNQKWYAFGFGGFGTALGAFIARYFT